MSIITVVIATYNRRELLDQTLQSLIGQSYPDFRVIVVDHGSTDHPEEISQKHETSLHLTHYAIPRENIFAAAVPKDFGVRHAETPLIVLLDTGSIATPWFIEAHVKFHLTHPQALGIGLQHGYRSLDARSGYQKQPHEVTDFRQAYAELQEANLQDQRSALDLERIEFPWFFAWGSNLSFAREAYLAAGGFDTTIKGWGFEDSDLGYRLSRYGLKLACVEDGWIIELPQERSSTPERFQTNLQNMRACYDKQRTLALEAMLLAILQLQTWMIAYASRGGAQGADQQIENIAEKMRDQFLGQATSVFHYLESLKARERVFAEKPDFAYARPALLIGGSAEDGEHFDYVALGDEHVSSTSTAWSCFGIVLPLADQELQTVVVTPIWKKLGWSIRTASGLGGTPLLEKLIREIRRSAKQAIFLEGAEEQQGEVSAAELAELCARHQLAFQIITLSPVS